MNESVSLKNAFKWKLSPFRIVLLYALVVGIWIPISDRLLAVFINKPVILIYVNTFKDFSYVLTTTWILYILINRNTAKLKREILERKEVEETLRKTEEEKKVILDSMSELVVYLDKNTKLIWANKAVGECVEHPLEQLVGRYCHEVWHGPSEVCKNCPVERAVLTGQPEKGEISTPDGRMWFLKVYPVMHRIGIIKGVVAVALEITERKLAEEERSRLVTAIEQANEAVIITDKSGTIQYVNPAFEVISGYLKDEVLGQNIQILKSGKHDEAFYREMWDKLSKGEVWKGRFKNERKNGERYEAETTISPVHNTRGEIINYVAVKRDVTQEVALEAQLRQAQKMEAIGTLAGGIAHDFNNILTPIIINTEMALLDIPDDSPITGPLQQILGAAMRAKDLVRQILTFSRQREEEYKPVAIAPLIKEALKLLRATLPSTIDIQQNITADSGQIMADPTRLHQVFMNLFTNAVHAMKEKGGILEVSLMDIELNAEILMMYPKLKPGPYLELIVRDKGSGMRSDVIERIFDPFYTTKEPGEGSGLGLSVTHGIVKSYGGAIMVQSQLGEGTTFHVLFPRAELKKLDENKTISPLPTGFERIFVVDDETTLIQSIKEMLERLGYQVEVCRNSIEALHILLKKPQQYDLVITDYTMPEMTGTELAEKVLDSHPNLPIILCTGFSDLVSPGEMKSLGIRELVMKPITTKRLAETIRKVLDSE